VTGPALPFVGELQETRKARTHSPLPPTVTPQSRAADLSGICLRRRSDNLDSPLRVNRGDIGRGRPVVCALHFFRSPLSQ
jgi:hypothetical protein